MLPYWKCDKIMGEIRKHIKFDDIGTLQFYYNEMHEKSVYEANYHNGMK